MNCYEIGVSTVIWVFFFATEFIDCKDKMFQFRGKNYPDKYFKHVMVMCNYHKI